MNKVHVGIAEDPGEPVSSDMAKETLMLVWPATPQQTNWNTTERQRHELCEPI